MDFKNQYQTFSDAYDVVSESFLNAVRRNLSNEGKFLPGTPKRHYCPLSFTERYGRDPQIYGYTES